MIRYSLKCSNGHKFESWFASSAAFEKLHAAGQVSCTVCGSSQVDKSLMAPARAADRPLSRREPSDMARALAKLRTHLQANSEDVGKRFAKEARAIQDGTAPERSIHGQAKPEEARALIEDGVPVLPLPIPPKDDLN